MGIATGVWDLWLLQSLVLLAALECATIVVLGRRSVALAQEQGGLQTTLDALRARMNAPPRLDCFDRNIVENDPEPKVCRDRTGRIVFANAAFATLLGITDGAGIVGSRRDLLPVEATPALPQPDGTRLVDEAFEVEGVTRWISWLEREVAGPDGSPCTWRSGRDVTARVAGQRRLECAREGAEAASAAKSRFLATISHEFRTPLNGIMGMSDLLLESNPTAEQASHARTIRGAAEAFLSLIEEILDFAAIEAGRVSLRPAPVDLVQLVEGVAELLAPRAHGKDIEIATCVACDAPRHVMADRARLRQILLNLAGNAVKFTQEGGVGILIERGLGDAIRFSVEDSGSGIAPERREAIFQDFEQGNGCAEGHSEGAGLGLAITRRLARVMGGDVTLDSEPGRGSTFVLDLDLPEAPVLERRRLLGCQGRSVLVMAPDTIALRLLARRLDDAGATVAVAHTIGEACLALSKGRFDVLIADLAMGEEAVREAASAAALAEVPRRIVMLSPFEKRAFGPGRIHGYDAYLTKPVRMRSLFQQVTAAASTRSAAPPPRPLEAARRPFLRVLLAEDNDVNALIAMRALEKVGATVDWARTGPEALALAEEALDGRRPSYDCVLMDMRLPGLDGCEVTRRIRQSECEKASGQRGRIVALSANVSAADRMAALAAGLDDFLPKPFTQDMLRAALLDIKMARAS